MRRCVCAVCWPRGARAPKHRNGALWWVTLLRVGARAAAEARGRARRIAPHGPLLANMYAMQPSRNSAIPNS